MVKRFDREPLNSEEIEEYMKWKHENKLARYAKMIKGVHMGSLIRVTEEVIKKKAVCEIGSCMGWNKDVYDGIFGQCGKMDPFWCWDKHVKQKEFDESLDVFLELFDYDTFEQPKGDGAQYHMNCFWQAKYAMFSVTRYLL